MPRYKGPEPRPKQKPGREKGSRTSEACKRYERVIDFKETAAALADDIHKAFGGSLDLDGRLWCLLHRVLYLGVHENPLIGARQVKAGTGVNYRSYVWYDIPSPTTDLNWAWRIFAAREVYLYQTMTMNTAKNKLKFENVSRYDGNLALAICEHICHTVRDYESFYEYSLPRVAHLKKRVRPREVFLEAWAPKLTAGIPKFGPKPKE